MAGNAMRYAFLKLVSVGMSTCLASSSFAAEAATTRVTVPAGTAVVLKLLGEINSNTVRTGDSINLVVSNDIVINGKVIVKQGAMALGQVQKSKKAGAVGAAGELVISIQTVPAIDGTQIPVNFTKSSEGDSKMGTSIVLTLLCCILFLLKKGENVSFPANSVFTALSIAPVEVSVP